MSSSVGLLQHDGGASVSGGAAGEKTEPAARQPPAGLSGLLEPRAAQASADAIETTAVVVTVISTRRRNHSGGSRAKSRSPTHQPTGTPTAPAAAQIATIGSRYPSTAKP